MTLRTLSKALIVAGLPLLLAVSTISAHQGRKAADVSVTDNGSTFTMSNGILDAKFEKKTGSIVGLTYRGLDLLGAMGIDANWALPASGLETSTRYTASVLVDPSSTKGERATISCKFAYDGGAKTLPADLEIRYSLARGDSALFLEEILDHKSEYPRLAYPVGRFVIKLNDDIFDWMTIDSRRSLKMITADDWNHGTVMNMKEARLMNSGVMKGQVEHKYDYAAIQFDTPVYGWSSTKDHIGIWLINPSNEYMSGGATKLELSAHRDATFTDSLTAPAPATILNVWKGPHYGGTVAEVEKGESWKKTIGPFLLYCNSGVTPEKAWSEAVGRAAREQRAWVYDWARDENYPSRTERGTVSGQIVLEDPFSHARNWLMGLAHADYKTATGELIDWQRDGKYYQFWVRADADGRFTIPNVRPGSYTLHAFAEGVLGEYSKTDIDIAAGKDLKLGTLDWRPVRYGRQLWEIGVPDRTASEYLHGDHYWQWGLYNLYPKEFPKDVNFVIGKSDPHRDWNLMQVPRGHDETGKGRGDQTTWSVVFDLPAAPSGKATLRVALAGIETAKLALAMNDIPIGAITGLANTSVIHRDSDRGYWQEVPISFNASAMHAGRNVLKLIVPAGPVMNGVEYDYLRLELDENADPGK